MSGAGMVEVLGERLPLARFILRGTEVTLETGAAPLSAVLWEAASTGGLIDVVILPPAGHAHMEAAVRIEGMEIQSGAPLPRVALTLVGKRTDREVEVRE